MPSSTLVPLSFAFHCCYLPFAFSLSFFHTALSIRYSLSLSLCSLASLKSVPQAILIFPGQLVCCDVLFIQRFIFRRPWVDWTGRAAPPVKRSVSLSLTLCSSPLSACCQTYTHTHTHTHTHTQSSIQNTVTVCPTAEKH